MRFLKIQASIKDGVSLVKISPIKTKVFNSFKLFLEALRNFQPYEVNGVIFKNNFPFGESCQVDLGEKTTEQLYVDTKIISPEAFEIFVQTYMPHDEYGVFQIESVEVFSVSKLHKIF